MSDDYPKLDDADIEKAENSVKVYDVSRIIMI